MFRRYSFNFKTKNGDEYKGIKSVGATPEGAWCYLVSNKIAQKYIDFSALDSDSVSWVEIPFEKVDPNNYKFEESKVKSGWYVVTDLKRNIVTIFPHGDFNSSQKHTELFDNKMSPAEQATAMRELGEYLYKYHKDKVGL